jgi:hypothetical protein
VHIADPLDAYVPPGHSEQVSGAVACEPASHSRHSLAPEEATQPLAHGKQLVASGAAVPALLVPMGQAVQPSCEGEAYLPESHASHVSAPPTEKLPAEHCSHSALPAVDAKVPAMHDTHADSLLAPDFEFDFPTAQFVQSTPSVVKVPGGHAVHSDDSAPLV